MTKTMQYLLGFDTIKINLVFCSFSFFPFPMDLLKKHALHFLSASHPLWKTFIFNWKGRWKLCCNIYSSNIFPGDMSYRKNSVLLNQSLPKKNSIRVFGPYLTGCRLNMCSPYVVSPGTTSKKFFFWLIHSEAWLNNATLRSFSLTTAKMKTDLEMKTILMK